MQIDMKDKIRNDFLARKAELLGHVRAYLHGSGNPDKLSLADSLDEAGDWVQADIFNKADIALLEHELAELNDIDAALRRLAEGNYGICTGCGQAISAERLLAQPTAQTCLACKQAFEKRRGFVHNGI